MKSNTKKRLVAFMLCMVLVLSSTISAFADEPQNTDSQSQTEAVAEPAADEATGDEATGDEADTTDIEIPSEKEWSVQVGNATVKVKGSADALPENAQLSVSEITSDDEVKEIEKAVEEKAIEEQFSIKNIFSYDIKFLVDGTEVQPTTPVQVSVDTPEITSDQNAAVLHVDDNNVAEDMNGTVDEQGNVVFDAPHFSVYVIVNQGSADVTVNLQHYYYDNNGEEKQLYADETVPLKVGEKIDNYSKSANYDVQEVKEQSEDGSFKAVNDFQNIKVTADKTYRIYYKENTGTTQGEVKFWDYDVNSKKKGNINSNSHYSRGDIVSEKDTFGNYTNRMTMGTKARNGLSSHNAYGTNTNTNTQELLNANNCNYGRDTNSKGTLGLLRGLSSDYKTVLWNVNQPGFFTDDFLGEGKTTHTDYKLNFNRSGNHYTLASVKTPKNEEKRAGADFWPLGDKNYYFGMRYDVEFEIGDYVGPMDYTFTGDDDLWVLLDGKVVIDVGGIHDALEGSTDLWEELGYHNGQRPASNDTIAKTTKHRITVLYMERGAGASNCQMDFTLPNSRILDVTEVPTTTLTLKKVNSQNEPIPGAKFKLVSKVDENDFSEVTSDTNGIVTFDKLKEGVEYTLTEDSAPVNYVKETTSWNVKVEKDTTGTLKAVLCKDNQSLTLNDDKTYHIVNFKQDELVSQSVESDKTVSVKDYDARTYKIDLTASSKVTQAVTTTTPYDIVMVLDTSGSMGYDLNKYTEYKGTLTPEYDYYYGYENRYFVKTDDKIYQSLNYSYKQGYWYYKDANSNPVKVAQGDSTKIYTKSSDGTKMTALKNAAKAFVSNVNEKNPDSRISIVSFSGSASIKNSKKKYLLRVGNSKPTIDSWIDELNADGATNTAEGFDKAKNVFLSDEKWANVDQLNGRKKMVVFLTDGVPTEHSSYDDDVAKDAVQYASDIKRDYEADIYSLGIFDAAGSNGKLSGASIATINTFMTDVASGSSKYMTADSIDSLYRIFNSITDNMPVSITATITDVIDSRFELTTGEKERLEGRGATVTENDGTTTVTWTNTTVTSKTGNTPGWHETIEIKAKDDFIGGNMIPTNGPASGITVGDNTKYFPQPSVNVKLLTPSIGDKEITYYKGDTIESSKFSGELLGTYKMTELDTTTAVEKGIPKLTEEQLTKLKKGTKVEVPYSYTNSNTDIEGTFVYEYKNTKHDTENTTVNSLEDHTATIVGKDVEEYTLTVVFVPKTVDERKTLLNDTAVLEPNADENISGTVVTNASVTGTYKVHVLALWAIVKQSTSTGSDGKHPMLSGAKFELVKDSKVCYTGKSNSDGFVEWYKDGKEVSLSEIEKTTYTLRETSAPAGYAKSEVQWTIAITDTTVTITGANGKPLTPTQLGNPTTRKTYDAYTYENTPVYDLPSTGGTGIYLYMIGGMLLMFAAVWILYKSKCKEVLGK